MNNKVNSVLNSIEKIDNLIMEADVSVSDAMSDVYSKQFKMEGNVTEDYINHEYYQESVIAGILIGGGIIAVLATAIVLITKHVKKSASGDPEKKNDTSTAAGTALDNQEELKKKVEQIKGELTKAGGSVEITNNGINTTELNKKFELVTKLCDSAEGFLKEKEDDLIKQEIENFTKQLEEINNIQYKSSETVTVSADSLTKIIDLAAPIKTMNDKLTKTAEELTKRSKENKNKSDSETDSDKKEKYNELKEGLERISKDSTQLSKDLTDDLNAIRSYMDAVLNAAKEKAKPSETESEKSQETPQNTDILKQKIYPITAKWASTPSNSDSNHPDAKLTADEAYNIIDSIHDNVVNHRGPIALNTLKAKANEDPTKAMLIKNLIEATINNKEVFDTEDEETINEIKSGLSELENIAANAPSEEPKKDESENSQEIKLSQEDTKNIAAFANTFVLQGKNKKGNTTMSKDDVKNILSEIARSIKSSQYDDINNKIFELFNKQDNIDLQSIFVDLMLTAKNPIFNGKAPSESLLSDMEKIASGKTIETEELKYKPNPKMDSVDASGKKSPDPTNGNPTLKDNNLMDSLSTITKSPAEILDAVIQNNPNYKKYENDQYAINKIIPELSKMRYDQLVQTVQAFTPPDDDPIKSSLLRDIAKEIAKEQGWTDKIDNIKLSDENEKRVNEYLRTNKIQLTDDTMNNIVTAIYDKRRTEGKQIIKDENDIIKNIINTMKNQGINTALSRNYNQLRQDIQDDASLTDSAKHMAELMHDTAVYYGNLIGEKDVIMPIPDDLTMASQTKSNEPEPEKKDETKPESEEPKSDDTDTKSLPTVSELINNVDNVDKIVEAYNQTAGPSDKIDSGEISSFKNAQTQIKIDSLEDIFNEFIKIYNIDLNMPISKSVFKTLTSASEDVNSCHGFESNLNDSFLSIKYEKYQNNPSRKQQIFDEAKKYAEMKNINVTLTKPDGTQVEVGTKSESSPQPEPKAGETKSDVKNEESEITPELSAKIDELIEENKKDINYTDEEIDTIREKLQAAVTMTSDQFLTELTESVDKVIDESNTYYDITGMSQLVDIINTFNNDVLNKKLDTTRIFELQKRLRKREREFMEYHDIDDKNIDKTQFEQTINDIATDMQSKYPRGCEIINLLTHKVEPGSIVLIILYNQILYHKDSSAMQKLIDEMIIGFISSCFKQNPPIAKIGSFESQSADYKECMTAVKNTIEKSVATGNETFGSNININTDKCTSDLNGILLNTIMKAPTVSHVYVKNIDEIDESMRRDKKEQAKQKTNNNENQSSESRLSFITNDTEKAINAANQRNEQGIELINDNEAKALRNADHDTWGFIEYYIFTKQHKKLNDLPFTRRLVKQLAQMAYRANKMEAMMNDLKGYLTNMYSKYTDPTAKQRIYDEVCTFVKYHPGLTAEVIDPDGNVKILNDPNEDWNV